MALLALSLSGAQVPHHADRIDLRELRVAGVPAPEDMTQIREGTPSVIPEGKLFVLTAVGRSYGTGGAHYIKVDGVIELAVQRGQSGQHDFGAHRLHRTGRLDR